MEVITEHLYQKKQLKTPTKQKVLTSPALLASQRELRPRKSPESESDAKADHDAIQKKKSPRKLEFNSPKKAHVSLLDEEEMEVEAEAMDEDLPRAMTNNNSSAIAASNNNSNSLTFNNNNYNMNSNTNNNNAPRKITSPKSPKRSPKPKRGLRDRNPKPLSPPGSAKKQKTPSPAKGRTSPARAILAGKTSPSRERRERAARNEPVTTTVNAVPKTKRTDSNQKLEYSPRPTKRARK